MANLEIRTPDGRSEVRRLSRRNPLIVGRNPISDVPIDDSSVAPIHCRLSWNGKSFEVAAVAGDGVDVNGVLVRRKELAEGDVIRVGAVDLVLVNGSAERIKAARSKPTSKPVPPGPALPPASEASDADLEVLSQGEIEIPVVQPVAGAVPPKVLPPREPPPEDELEVLPAAPTLGTEARKEYVAVATSEPQSQPERSPAKPEARGFGSQLRGRRRPGEQDAVRSPLVIGLGGLALLLLLAAAATWLLIGREGADRLHQAATAARESRRFAEAIADYEQFLKEYPGDSRADEVRFELGRANVERHMTAASPDWHKAIAEFDRFARANRDEPDFARLRGQFLELASSIASGAAADATRSGSRETLAAASEGRKLFDRYAPADDSKKSARDRLVKGYEAAEAAVRKREYFEDAATKIEAALAKADLSAAFEIRSNLLTRYPDLASNKRVQKLLADTLDAERKFVKTVEPARRGQAAETTTGPSATDDTLTVVGHTQARAGEVSDGRLIFVVARDVLFGLDAVTGRPLWRRPIGLDLPFFPVEVDAAVPSLLAFDSARDDLVLFAKQDGEPLWRSDVGAAIVGPPLVSQGQIDLATSDGRLLRFSLATGELLAGVAFPQRVVGPPVLAGDGERLVLFGDRATAYTLDLRSLAVRAVSFTGQSAGAIVAPPAALGRLVMACENDRLESAVLRAFTVDSDTGMLRQTAAERVEGVTRQPLVDRGNVLLVPSSPERITAFSVSDDPGRPPLTRLSSVQIPDGRDVPTFLVAGPEGMLWEAGSALRKLRLGPDGFELLPGSIAPGRHTQPPQESGESLFVARSVASSPAVYVSQADREEMTGTWRTVIGGSILAAAVSGDAATLLTDAGQVAVLGRSQPAGFIDAKALPGWDEASPEPLRATIFGDGRAVAWRGGQDALLWVMRPGEEPGQPRRLAGSPECPPISLDGGIVIPSPGRLEWLSDSGRQVEPFLLPVGGGSETQPKWRSLARLDGDRLIAVDDAGTLRLIAVRPEPASHLAELASTTLDPPYARPVVAVDGKILVAADRSIRLLNPAGLRPLSETVLDAAVTGGPWVVDGSVFVHTDPAGIVALDGDGLAVQWQVLLDSPSAGGPVRFGEHWIIASQTGGVVTVDEAGAERSRTSAGETLTGLQQIGGVVYALSLGGSLLPVRDPNIARATTSGTEPSQ